MRKMKEIECRAAVISDLPILFDFEQGIIRAERPYDSTLKDGHFNYYDIKAMIESVDTEVIVAVHHEEVVGSAYVSIRKSKPYLKHTQFGYLGFMYVKPEFRGLGVNNKIINAIKSWARAKDIKELCLDVYVKNLSAVKAYEKAGFEPHLVNMRMEV